MNKNIFRRALSLTLCGTMLFTTPTLTAYADELNNNIGARAANITEAAAYMTTTPKVMVGDTAMACMSGRNYSAAGNTIQWFRSPTKDVNSGEAIEGATGVWYTYTEFDIGYYVYAVISTQNENGEAVSLVTNLADKPVSKKVEEVEDWIVSSDTRWSYDILDGTNNVQIRATDAAGDSMHGLIGDITIPSSLDGYTVTKLADKCFESACTVLPGSGSSKTCYITSIRLPNTLEEIGDNLNFFNGSDKNIVVPESVKYIKGNPFSDYIIYTYNGYDGSTTRSLSKLTIKNPTCHFDQIPATATSLSRGRVTYAGAIGGSLWNVYQNELTDWQDAGELPSAREKYYWQDQGVYNASSNSLSLSDKETLQQKLDENVKDWQISSDEKFQVDDIDDTDKVVIKPIQTIPGEPIKIPDTVDGKEVGAVEITDNGYATVIDVPKDVIIDRENTSLDDSAVISGTEGSDAEDYAKENDLVFQNKSKLLTTYEEYEAATKSSEKTSEDGYWSYQFIDGYNGVVIKNIKSFGEGAIVEVPETIDGFKVTAFEGAGVEARYDSMSLPECITVVTSPTLFHGSSHGGAFWTTVIAKNLTVYNRNADLSIINNNTYYNTTITGWTGSTADNLCINRIDGTTNEHGVVKSIFIPLDSKPSLSEVSISGLNQEGQTLKAVVKPVEANTIDYVWLVSDDDITFRDIEDSNAAEFIIPEGYAGKYLKVQATGKENFTGSIESSSIQVASKDAVRVYYLQIGSANSNKYIGETLKTTIYPSGATANYQWYRDINEASAYDTADANYTLSATAEKIEGAIDSTYTITAADAGKYLFVVATGKGNYFGGYQSASISYPVQGNIGKVSIIDNRVVKYTGDMLVSNLSNTDYVDKVRYQWYRYNSIIYANTIIPSDAEKIEGATDKTYTIKAEDVGKYIFVAIEGIPEEGVGGIATSDSLSYEVYGKVEGVSIIGLNYIGQTLEAIEDPEGATVTYQWYRSKSNSSSASKEAIDEATNSSYTLTEADKDYYISVVISGVGSFSGSATAFTTELVKDSKLLVENISLTGETKVGETLTVNVEPSDATVDIEWFRADSKEGPWNEIEGTTDNNYTLIDDDINKFIKVVVTGKGSYEGIREVITDEAVKADAVEISKVTISGNTTVGNTLTTKVYPSSINADIRWLAATTLDGDYEEIGTGNTYILTENDLDKYIKAEATNVENRSNVVLSEATSKVSNENVEPEAGGKIKDSVEKVDYIQEDMTEVAFDNEEQRDVMVYASQGQSFSVRIPKRIVFDGSSSTASVDFETEVTADISGNDTITVRPEVDTLEMEEAAGIKRPLICDLTVGQTNFSILNDTQEVLETGKVANHTATINKLTAGSWKGTFNWLITARGKEIEDSTN